MFCAESKSIHSFESNIKLCPQITNWHVDTLIFSHLHFPTWTHNSTHCSGLSRGTSGCFSSCFWISLISFSVGRCQKTTCHKHNVKLRLFCAKWCTYLTANNHTRMHIWKHTHTHTIAHAHAHNCTCTHTHAHTIAHTHTHTTTWTALFVYEWIHQGSTAIMKATHAPPPPTPPKRTHMLYNHLQTPEATM